MTITSNYRHFSHWWIIKNDVRTAVGIKQITFPNVNWPFWGIYLVCSICTIYTCAAYVKVASALLRVSVLWCVCGLDRLTPGVWVNGQVGGCRAWRRRLQSASGSRLIETKTWTFPAAPVSISHMPRTPPFGRAALAKAVPLRAAAQPVWPFEVLCLANQPRRRPARLPWLGFTGRRQTGEETHSTLINTWPHYLSRVAESRKGKI